MSKSLGNLVTIDDFLSRHEADALRMMVFEVVRTAPRSPTRTNIMDASRTRAGPAAFRPESRPGQRPGAPPKHWRRSISKTRQPKQTFVKQWTMTSIRPWAWRRCSNWYGQSNTAPERGAQRGSA